MATIKESELHDLKKQMRSLARFRGGWVRLVDLFYRMIAQGPQPDPMYYDPNLYLGYGYGYGGNVEPEETITAGRKTLLLSETPADKSLWYRVNYELADIVLNQEELIKGTTGDELRLVRQYANTLSAPEKAKLLDALTKIEPAEQVDKYDLPEIDE